VLTSPFTAPRITYVKEERNKLRFTPDKVGGSAIRVHGVVLSIKIGVTSANITFIRVLSRKF
jgi:hypothetical protein